MKKTLFLAIFSLLALPTFAFATIDTNLKYGAKGDEVVELQEFLIDKGFLQGTATGNFFALTKKAVISYQSSVGLPATGFVGQLTRAEINKELQNNDEAEIKETGAVSEPVKTSQTDVLKAQLDSLIAQIQALKEEQKKTTEQAQQTTQAVQQVVQNTVKPVTPTVPMLGSGVPEPVDKSEIVINVTNENIYKYNNQISGAYSFKVSVLDKNGKYIKANINMTDGEMFYTRDTNSITNININDWNTTFSYIPKTSGKKTITFTSNGLSKSIDIDVTILDISSISPSVTKLSDFVIENNREITSARFGINTNGGEPIYLDSAEIDTNIPYSAIYDYGEALFRFPLPSKKTGTSVVSKITNTKEFSIKVIPTGEELKVGNYFITIKSLRAIGLSSGEYKEVQGLPITYTFEVK